MSVFSHALSTNNYGESKFIVSSSPSNGTHTTIASALTTASSGDTIFLRPGTYTEDLTLKAGVNLAAYECDAFNNVIISGKCTFTAAGTVSLSGIQLKTNGDFALAVTGSAVSIVNLSNCFINANNNTAISYTVANTSSRLNFYYCTADVATTGITVIADSSTGSTRFLHCQLNNSGNSVTANTKTAGLLGFFYCFVQTPLSYASAGGAIVYTDIDNSGNNSTMLTTSGTSTLTVSLCYIASGTASAVSIGAGTIIGMSNCTVNSTNTNALTGAGTLNYGLIVLGQSSGHNVSTETPVGVLL